MHEPKNNNFEIPFLHNIITFVFLKDCKYVRDILHNLKQNANHITQPMLIKIPLMNSLNCFALSLSKITLLQ